MKGFHRLSAIAAPLNMDTVDTDQIFPARFMGRDRRDRGFGDCFLHDLRFDAEGGPRPDFVLNDPRLRGAGILVAGAGYGIGSGRPGAVLAHLDYGIRAVVAEGFGPVFSAVAYKSGLLTIELDRDTVRALRAEIDADRGSRLVIDLETQTLSSPRGIEVQFAIDPFVKRIIGEGIDEVELTLTKAARIGALERQQHACLPWLFDDERAR